MKFDVNRLTEHQKESLKRRKEDIAALCNDLSQSSSQDTQNLQEWFNKKSKILEEADKSYNKNDNISIKSVLDDDANKENKIEVKELETIKSSDAKSDSIEQNIPSESMQKVKDNIDNNENSLVENQMTTMEYVCDNTEAKSSTDSTSRELDANIQGKLEENKDEQRLSPSILDNSKRRHRFNVAVKSTSPKSLLHKFLTEESINNEPGQSNTTNTLQRTLRIKITQDKSEMFNKQETSENVENKPIKEERRGIKRKSTSDSENEAINIRQRKKTLSISDSDSCKSTENDNATMNLNPIIDETNLSQRTKNEISRLRINMVFDSPLSRRRSRISDDKEIAKKQLIENKAQKEVKKRGRRRKSDKIEDMNVEDIRKDKRTELEEQKKIEETAEIESSKSISDNKCNLLDTQKFTEISDIQHMRTENNHTQNDMEDIIEDSQTLSKLSKLPKVKIEINKIENLENILQNKNSQLENEKRVGEKVQEEEIQTEVTSKSVSDDNCDLHYIKKSTKINVEAVNNNKSNNEIEGINQDVKSVKEKSQTQDDTEDIAGSSQEELFKKCNEKQYFIKINKLEDICSSTKCYETIAEDEEVAKIVSNDCDNDNIKVPKDNVKEFEETNEVSTSEPKISTPFIEINLCDNEKDTAFEEQKINDGSTLKSLFDLSSPKSCIKRQAKFKTFAAQGRAAHMLGLVTKQARMEAESSVTNDEESIAKKLKSKDVDNDTLLGKKEQSMLKEVDKITATCSSRQEKIFSNMRSTDYCSSPPIKLFSNLKNDGEKIFSRTDKLVDSTSVHTETQTDKMDEEILFETDELPILEWSSANPPSLTASPSASILKRQRQYIPEPDPESVTPSKVISFRCLMTCFVDRQFDKI